MSKVLRRPMFRKGGNVGTGIMTGIVDREGYDNGSDPFTGRTIPTLKDLTAESTEALLEAARIDGAGEFRIILSVIIPYIKGTIITVGTTIIILTLKIFDIVYSMTGGNYSTDVIATLQYKEMFVFKNYNMGSTYAIILLIAVLPAIFYNLKQFRERRAF